MQYKFEANNIPLGDGGGLSVVELRPIEVNDNISAISSFNSPPTSPYAVLSKEASMKEYADLKISLLLYDFILVVTGATILSVSSDEADAYSFLAGGIGGFLYLSLLQRSVDGLSALEDDEAEKSLQNFGLKGPVMCFALVIATIIVSSKYWNGGPIMVFSPSELFIGVAGFLTCKIAVVLAALRPIQMSDKENESQ